CYAPQQAGAMSIEPGKPYVARYRIVVADGGPDAELFARLAGVYAEGKRTFLAGGGGSRLNSPRDRLLPRQGFPGPRPFRPRWHAHRVGDADAFLRPRVAPGGMAAGLPAGVRRLPARREALG